MDGEDIRARKVEKEGTSLVMMTLLFLLIWFRGQSLLLFRDRKKENIYVITVISMSMLLIAINKSTL